MHFYLVFNIGLKAGFLPWLGQVEDFVDLGSGKSYAAPGKVSPLLQLRIDGAFCKTDSMEWNAFAQETTLHCGSVQAVV